ncbi:hydroxyacylglutathione hydrolase [Paenirhodobacter populi]|uniref:hydroxyacylglutathione hydrolase n=1 Tax=Paenirhodobacter populi TaxID=2306993 RepID=UPI000FE32A9C|nr:hydroxyacylglutathione hydrolase [Sinirhodobacter populi]RWR09482.1 hydroxyacylglutathione hydrolase [Sinirhodobacter populi]
MTLDLQIIPCLSDNYAWLIHDETTDTTAVIDVPDAVPVLDALQARGWKLTHILITHHHEDHIAGVEALSQATGARVVGARRDSHRLPPLTDPVEPGDSFPVGIHAAEVLDAAGHTVGHIAYYLPGPGLLFSGDSLMSWGCGRLFEGPPVQMFDTLTRMAALPPETRICSGHEYTEANGRFALSLEPMHSELLNRMEEVRILRAKGEPTLPATLERELATNPFLRGEDPALKAALGLSPGASALETFTEARARKDRF